MHWSLLQEFRRAEGDQALAGLRLRKPPPARLVEIGGGSGWQARLLAEAGYDVTSFDLASSAYTASRTFPVQDYDGHRLPLDDASVDVVFSSNVLEHIPHVRAFQGELHRILKPDGIAVHLLPTASWRHWTTMTHYPWVATKLMHRLASRRPGAEAGPGASSRPVPESTPARRALANNLVPARHGEFGNALTELYYFSRPRWSRLFTETGWRIEHYATNGLAYTGHSLFGEALSLDARRQMSRILGSACHIFVLRKA